MARARVRETLRDSRNGPSVLGPYKLGAGNRILSPSTLLLEALGEEHF